MNTDKNYKETMGPTRIGLFSWIPYRKIRVYPWQKIKVEKEEKPLMNTDKQKTQKKNLNIVRVNPWQS